MIIIALFLSIILGYGVGYLAWSVLSFYVIYIGVTFISGVLVNRYCSDIYVCDKYHLHVIFVACVYTISVLYGLDIFSKTNNDNIKLLFFITVLGSAFSFAIGEAIGSLFYTKHK